MNRTVVLLVVVLLLISCKDVEKQIAVKEKTFEKLSELNWLVGNWSNITEKEQSYENWEKVNDSTLKAHSFTLKENDTVFAERVTLYQNNRDLFFKVVAYNQNDDKPVTFKLKSSKNGIFTFENPKHDFPTRISYSNPVKDSIHAWIEGTVDNNTRKIDFYFTRH